MLCNHYDYRIGKNAVHADKDQPGTFVCLLCYGRLEPCELCDGGLDPHRGYN